MFLSKSYLNENIGTQFSHRFKYWKSELKWNLNFQTFGLTFRGWCKRTEILGKGNKYIQKRTIFKNTTEFLIMQNCTYIVFVMYASNRIQWDYFSFQGWFFFLLGKKELYLLNNLFFSPVLGELFFWTICFLLYVMGGISKWQTLSIIGVEEPQINPAFWSYSGQLGD